MGYLHIENLYKNQDVLMFKEVYCLAKIDGSSANISYKYDDLTSEWSLGFFGGRMKHEAFVKLWAKNTGIYDYHKLTEGLKTFDDVTIFGEVYGGKIQKGSKRYGVQTRFVVFDVKVGDCWLSVPQAQEVALACGLEFVWYTKSSTSIEELNKYRDMPSEQAKRNGVGDNCKEEGIVIRPLVEMVKNNGKRIIAKHKRDDFKETKTGREVTPERLKVLADAKAISEEWVVEQRLSHVLDKLGNPGIEDTSKVIKAMIEDVKREGEGEIVWSKEVSKAIGSAAAVMFKQRLQQVLQTNGG